MSAAQLTTRQEELQRLKQEKQRLSLDAVNGNKQARTDLQTAVKQIAQLESEIELEDLAAVEQARRDAEAEKDRQAAERLAKETRLIDLRADAEAKWRSY